MMPPARRSPGTLTGRPQAALGRGIGGGRAFGDVDGASGGAVAGAGAASALIDAILDFDKVKEMGCTSS
uniref:Uncharacterized protein n=1 Tax=Oryza brachyantha TaxID=4533 RepID=J3LPX1_ORYBR